MNQETGLPGDAAPTGIAEYVFDKQLGPAVYLGHHSRGSGQPLAIKLLAAPFYKKPKLAARFLTENKALVSVRSDHLAAVLDVGSDEQGQPFVVREFLKGPDLEMVARAFGPLPLPQVAEFGLQALEGLSRAHAVGRLHKNLKPTNVLVVRRFDGAEQVKICDFGGPEPGERIQEGRDPHVLLWAAPEQRRVGEVGPAADVYSLMALLVLLITGRVPTVDEQGWPLARLDPEMLGDGLAQVLRKGLAVDPKSRYPDAASLARDLVVYSGRRAERAGREATVVASSAMSAEPHTDPAAPMVVEDVLRAERELADPEAPTVRPRKLSPRERAALEKAVLGEHPDAPTDKVRGDAARAHGETRVERRPTGTKDDDTGEVQVGDMATAKTHGVAPAAGVDDELLEKAGLDRRKRVSLPRLVFTFVIMLAIGLGAVTLALGPKTWTEPGGLGEFLRSEALKVEARVLALRAAKPAPDPKAPAEPAP
jgi:hypothetical protein